MKLNLSDIKSKLKENRKLRKLRILLKKTTIYGFKGVPIWDVCAHFIREAQRDDIVIRANSMAFNFFLSIFPCLLIIISLIPYIPIEGFENTFYNTVFEILPSDSEKFLGKTIKDLGERHRGNLLSSSLLLALFFGSNGLFSMINGFEKSNELTFKSRNFFQKRFTSLWLLFLLGIVLFAACIFIIISHRLENILIANTSIDSINIIFILIGKWIFIFFLIYTLIYFVYRFGAVLKQNLPFFSPGSTLTTFLLIITTILFSVYINKFNTYNKVYGSIGAVIATMVWLEINCLVLLIGYELNASIAVNRDLRNSKEDCISTT